MPTKTTGKGLQRVTSRVWYVTDPDKPRPREHAEKGARPCCAALEKRKAEVLNTVTLSPCSASLSLSLTHTHTHSLSLSLSHTQTLSLSLSLSHTHRHYLSLSLALVLSLSFRSSDQLQQTVPIIHLFSHSNEKHYKWTRVRLLCCIKALIRIKPYIKS